MHLDWVQPQKDDVLDALHFTIFYVCLCVSFFRYKILLWKSTACVCTQAHTHIHTPYTDRQQPLPGPTAQITKNILSCKNPAGQGSSPCLAEEEEEGVLAGTGQWLVWGCPALRGRADLWSNSAPPPAAKWPQLPFQAHRTKNPSSLSPYQALQSSPTQPVLSTFPLHAFLLRYPSRFQLKSHPGLPWVAWW